MDTTVIEIDPMVYRFARKYFALSEPSSVFLEDARKWVHERGSEEGALHTTMTPELKFDYVVHDCFSGGGVPEHLFSTEFWKDLRGVMDPDGVVAVVSFVSSEIVRGFDWLKQDTWNTELCRKIQKPGGQGYPRHSSQQLHVLSNIPRPLSSR